MIKPPDYRHPDTPSSLTRESARGGQRLAASIYEMVKARLLDGRYTAGQRLQVEALKSEFEVSKQPVMEALRRLAADGLLEIIPQVGCQVLEYSPREVQDFFAMFSGFEGAIAEAAATRRTDEQLAELDRTAIRIATLRSEPDADRRSHVYRMLNRDFHSVIHAMAHSRVMADMSHRMWDLSDFLLNTAGAPQPLASALSERHAEHERIREALTDRDAARARRVMEQHIIENAALIHPPRPKRDQS